MLNILQSLRYFIFGVFVICSAIITSVAVWNLSLVQSDPADSTAKAIDAYLIFVGASGLVLIFIVIFCELASKAVFFVRVWFELIWVGAFWVMQLIGAAVITAQSNSQLCDASNNAPPTSPTIPSSQESPCASSQVLQAFTWVSAILLLGYFTLLSILTVVTKRNDSTILHCSVHRFPLTRPKRSLESVPTSPYRLKFRPESPPIIAAPRPQRIAQLHEANLARRSDLSLDYEIEHYQNVVVPQVVDAVSLNDGHRSPVQQEPPSSPPALQPLRLGQRFSFQQSSNPPQPMSLPIAQPIPQPTYSTPFYHSAVKTVLDKEAPRIPAPVRVSLTNRSPPSPPPLGDWPRLDATSRPRTKRKPLPQPLPRHETQPQPPPQARPEPPPRVNTHPQAQGPSRTQPIPPHHSLARGQSQTRALPLPQPPLQAASSYTFDASALEAALQPLAAQPSSWRPKPKPTGPRRRESESIDDGRPAHLSDLSNIGSLRSPMFGPR